MLGEPHADIPGHKRGAGHASCCAVLPTMMLHIYFSHPPPISPQYLPMRAARWVYLCLCSVINIRFISVSLAKMGCCKGTLCKACSVSSSDCCIYLLSIDFSFGSKCSAIIGGRRSWMQECVADAEGLQAEILKVFASLVTGLAGQKKKKSM